jgi:hypothetical protein
MDPTAASTDTASALQSALDAAYREREALSQRLDEVDRLIADLSQAAEGSSAAASRSPRTTQRPSAARTGTTKKTTRKSAKKGVTKGQRRKATTTGQRKAATTSQRKAAAKKGAERSAARKQSGGTGQEMGRTDRVVQIIAEADRPLTTGDVRSKLSEHEPDVTSKLVSASLSYAQRKERIRKSTDGRWVPASE